MEIKLNKPGLEDAGYFPFAEKAAEFFQVLANPFVLKPLEIRKAKSWLISLVVIPEGEDKKKYIKEITSVINKKSVKELIEMVSLANSDPDPK